MTYKVICANVLDWAREYDGPKFHAVLCDPPYDYAFMGKDWDDAVAMKPDTWAAIAQHLHPGAFLMAFGGARTYHRLAVALEDAGLVIHPALGYLQGQGFPKSTRINRNDNGHDEWDGHRYGLQALKPALEFIALAQVPYQGKPVESITGTGAGALNIDGGRIIHSEECRPMKAQTDKRIMSGDGKYQQAGRHANTLELKPSGRWPANFALVHDAQCRRIRTKRVQSQAPIYRRDAKDAEPDDGLVYGKMNPQPAGRQIGYADADGLESVAEWECVESCPVRKLGEQSGERRSGAPILGTEPSHTGDENTVCYSEYKRIAGNAYGDKGTAARFFFNADWQHEVAESIAAADAVRYQAKAGRKERDAGLDAIQAKKRDPSRHIGQPSMNDGEGNPYNHGVKPVRNSHPTVKAISLTKWLATLLLPPPEYAPRRILVPFAGSGNEAIGALLAGWDEIVIIDIVSEYCAISEARLAWWAEQAAGTMFNDVKDILKSV